MDFKKYIPEIEKKIRYKFKDKSLLMQAFTRSSYCNEHKSRGTSPASNEVLEFFGDSVLSTSIVSLLMKSNTKRFEHGISTPLKEGDFSAIRSKLSDKSNLSRTTASLGLEKYLLLGEGDAKLGIANEPSVMEDLFESIIGAIYIDCDMDISVVIGVVSGLLDVEEYSRRTEAPMQSYKNALQEWCADKKHRLPAPVYKTLSESGPDHKKSYERACFIGDRLCGTGIGKNQKLADTAAAKAALELLMSEQTRASSSAIEALSKIKDYATKNKLPSAQFRDLGETEKSTESTKEYAIECRFAGKSACGTGPSKQDARAKAAEAILIAIEEENKPKSKKAPAEKSAKAKKPSGNRTAPKQKEAVRTSSGRPSPAPKRTPAHHKKFS